MASPSQRSTRTLDALRQLAERPGTEAEGIAARELLHRFESGDVPEFDVIRYLASIEPEPLTPEEWWAVKGRTLEAPKVTFSPIQELAAGKVAE